MEGADVVLLLDGVLILGKVEDDLFGRGEAAPLRVKILYKSRHTDYLGCRLLDFAENSNSIPWKKSSPH